MKKEYLYAILISIAVLLLANTSYIVPNLIKKDGLIFLSRGRINAEDTYTYLSTIEQVRQGRILTENQYTSEPQRPLLLRPSYILIGNAARSFNISSLNAYNLFRILFSALFCLVLYKFLSLFFESSTKRLTAYSLILSAGGLGFLLNTINTSWVTNSIDLWVPEGFTFLSFAEAPHFILSVTLLILGFYFFIKYLKSGNTPPLVGTFFVFFALSFEHPFDVIVAVPVLFLTALWSKKSFFESLAIAFFSGIGLVYQFVATKTNPILALWNAQNTLYSPPPTDYVLGYGLLLVLAVIGFNTILDKKDVQSKLILLWVGVTAILLYIPVNFQRRFIEGVQIPLAIAGTFAISKKSLLVIVATIVFMASGSMVKVAWDFQKFSQSPDYYYIDSRNLDGIKWLGTKTTFDDVILSNRYFGNLIPGLIGRKVYLGHQIQTIDFPGKIQKTNEFLLEIDNKKALAFLKENHITYVFLGGDDSITQYGFAPDKKPYLTKIYDKDGVTIYKVK